MTDKLPNRLYFKDFPHCFGEYTPYRPCSRALEWMKTQRDNGMTPKQMWKCCPHIDWRIFILDVAEVGPSEQDFLHKLDDKLGHLTHGAIVLNNASFKSTYGLRKAHRVIQELYPWRDVQRGLIAAGWR